jgi:prefoldin subunit 5
MSLFTKILIAITVLANLIYFVLSGSLFSYQVHYKNKLNDKKKELQETITKNNAEIMKLRGDINSAQLKNLALGGRVEAIKISTKERQNQRDETQENITILQDQINDLKSNNNNLSQNLAKITTRNGDIQTQVSAIREKQQQMQKNSDQLQEEMQKIADELAQASKNLSLLDDNYIELSKKYQFAEQSLKYYESLAIEKPIGPQKVIRGKIYAVSDKQNIVVISVGEANGVAIGTEFTVYRSDKYIGKIRVDKVEKDYSSAMIIPSMMKDVVKAQDDIITSPY